MQYYYPQQPQYPQQPVQPPVMPVPQLTPEEQYRKKLRRVALGLGGMLIAFFGLEFILAILLEIPIAGAGLYSELTGDSVLLLLLNGVISVVIFFGAGLVYCLIRRLSFSEIFPFEKIGAAKLSKLCVIGLAFSLMSNYVVDFVNNTFGLVGLENTGGTIDTGSNPNVLIYFLTVAILPALAEEFAFRGVVMGALRPYSEALAILVSSAAFALMHGNFVQLPFTFCCGIVFAMIDVKTNSLLPSIIVHFLNNGLSVLADVLISYNILDNTSANVMYGAIFAVTGVLAFIFLKGFTKKQPELFTLKGGNDGIPFKRKVTAVASSPTMIVYTVLMGLYCLFTLLVT